MCDTSGISQEMFPKRNIVVYNNKTYRLLDDMIFNESHVIAIIFCSSLFLLSAVGNITVLYVIIKNGYHKVRLNKMLIHLAIADLLVTFIIMPTEIIWAGTVSWWATDASCRLIAFFRTFGLFQSSFVLVCISIDRYLAVLKPLKFANVDKRGKTMLTCAWTAAFICSFPQIVVFHTECHPKIEWYTQCVTFNSFPTKQDEFLYFLFGMLMMYAFPLAFIIYCYFSILTVICIKSKQVDSDNLRRSSLRHLRIAKDRTLKMTLAIVIAFFVCWTPYHIMALWYWVDRGSAEEVDQRLQKGLFIFACANSSVNPIVYGLFNLKRRSKQNGTTHSPRHLHNKTLSLQNNSFKSSRNTILSTAI